MVLRSLTLSTVLVIERGDWTYIGNRAFDFFETQIVSYPFTFFTIVLLGYRNEMEVFRKEIQHLFLIRPTSNGIKQLRMKFKLMITSISEVINAFWIAILAHTCCFSITVCLEAFVIVNKVTHFHRYGLPSTLLSWLTAMSYSGIFVYSCNVCDNLKQQVRLMLVGYVVLYSTVSFSIVLLCCRRRLRLHEMLVS